jgi:hypothetical protein
MLNFQVSERPQFPSRKVKPVAETSIDVEQRPAEVDLYAAEDDIPSLAEGRQRVQREVGSRGHRVARPLTYRQLSCRCRY